MIRFIWTIFGRIACVIFQSPKSISKAQSINRQDSYSKEKPSMAHNILLIGGLAMLLLGMIYGGIYGAFFLEKLLESQSDRLGITIGYAARGKVEEANKVYKKISDVEELRDTLSSGHSHLSVFGLIALAMAANIRKVRLKEKWKIIAAAVLLAGGLLLPIGVVLQPLVNKSLGKIISIIGGTGIMSGIAVYLWGVINFTWKSYLKK